jgi:hypothetical protein
VHRKLLSQPARPVYFIPSTMIKVNLGMELGGYTFACTAELARWPGCPLDIKFIVKLAPLALELRFVLVVAGDKMEFAVLKLL